MLVVKDIETNIEKAKEGLLKRNINNAEELLNEVLELDKKRKSSTTELEATLSKANGLAKEIGQLFKSGQKDEAEQKKSEAAALRDQSAELKDKLHEVESDLQTALYNIPNIPNEIVPAGNTEEDNEVVYEKGEIPTLHKKAVPHWDLLDKYKLVDFETGVKISGAGFPIFTGKGARLQRALINLFLDEATKVGYDEVTPPLLVNEASGYGTGQLPDKEGQMYHVQDDDLYLIPTAEVPITNIYRDVIINEADLPKMNVGYTPCFRREAGSYGKDVRGLNRLHQFDKVEIVQINKPEESYEALTQMIEHVKELLEKLELPFRILKLCGGDLGFTSAITYDFEVYSAAQQRWLEVSSVSNFETYQANRLKLRYRPEGEKPQLAHTCNGSALALPRIIAALLENNQTDEGIKIPEALQKYTGFDMIS